MSDPKFPPGNNLPAGYVPPKVWTWDSESGGAFAKINRPIAGPTHEKVLPVGKHPIQLYSLGTPNGVKVTILLEELLAAGESGAEYDAWLINIGDGDQFGSGFVEVNPNSKIPAMMDHAPKDGGAPVRLFESASMMVYLAEKFGKFLPSDMRQRAETMNWLMWQMGSAPFLGGGFGHFYAYAPMKIEYAINRTQWRSSARWMCWIGIWPTMSFLQETIIRLLIWRSGPGTGAWRLAALIMMREVSCPCRIIPMCSAGQTRSRNVLQLRAALSSIWRQKANCASAITLRISRTNSIRQKKGNRQWPCLI